MSEAAASVGQRSRWIRAWDVLRGHEEPTPLVRDDSVSFGELVWAHHKRQEALEHQSEPAAEDVYRRRLMRFKAEYGKVIETYWCRYEASGVALTELDRPRRLRSLFRRDCELRFHTATDWRTEHASRIETALHRWETLAIRIGEILRGPGERIALHRVFAATTRLIAFADREDAPSASVDPDLESVLAADEKEFSDVQSFYVQAGENSARIVYFHGMILGALTLAVLVGASFLFAWSIQWIHPEHKPTYTLFVTLAMGALGAILSVMTRMKRRDGWGLEWEVGRKSVRFLGSIRPWIGALFALALYLAIKGQLVDAFPGAKQKELYFYATVAFLAGFSERWAQVLLGNTAGKAADASGADRSAEEGGDKTGGGPGSPRR